MKKLFKIGLWGLFTTALAAALAYLMRGKIWEKVFSLAPATYKVRANKGFMVRMRDGVSLATDHYKPETDELVPTILIRTPYGRGGNMGLMNTFFANRFAERGYHVITQDVRGRFDSEGEPFEPFVFEAQDGEDTINWIASQPWFDGQIGMWGASYLGYVQWAAAASGSPYLKALVPLITQSNLGASNQRQALVDNILRWMLILDTMTDEQMSMFERLQRTFDVNKQDQMLAEVINHLPLSEADQKMLRKTVPFYQKWNEHTLYNDPYWEAVNHNDIVPQVTAPAYLVGGWYDIFLKGQLADYERLKAAGRQPYLLIGPWTHLSPEVTFGAVKYGVEWFDWHFKGQRTTLQPQPVRVFVMGADEWHDMESWPPPATTQQWYLQAGQQLMTTPSTAAESSTCYLYDPADPTPNIGGALLATSAGPKDNRPIEERDDVLVFTTAPLTQDIETIGYVKLILYVKSSVLYSDFYGRLCDVHPDGRSINLCDGLIRLEPEDWATAEDGVLRLEVELAATAQRFLAGHCIRVQVSSGAHPRFGRNLGTGESAAVATRMVAAEQTIFHDVTRPSCLQLPLCK